jgi:formate dehydrogenase maturation protein FdhE
MNQEIVKMNEVENQEKLDILDSKDILEDIRELLKEVPNKNALYDLIGLNRSYLNLKNFINGREDILKQKSLDHLLKDANVKQLTLFVNMDDLTEEEVKVLHSIHIKFLTKLSNIISPVMDLKKRKTVSKSTEADKKEVQDILNDILSKNVGDIEIDI